MYYHYENSNFGSSILRYNIELSATVAIRNFTIHLGDFRVAWAA